MWCRFLTFCVLVSFILFVVASCIYGRPSFHLFFHRCCGDDIENDQVIFENFGNNFLKERLVGGDIIEADSGIVFENENVGRINDEAKDVSSINDPGVKKWIEDTRINDSDAPDTVVEDRVEKSFEATDEELEYKLNANNNDSSQIEDAGVTEIASTLSVVMNQEKEDDNKIDGRYEEQMQRSEKQDEEVTEAASRMFLNVRDLKHKQIARTL